MGDSLITIVAIGLAAILMFLFPLAAISEMNDSETLTLVQSYTTEFVDDIRTKGVITQEDYDSFVQKLYATGNSYKIEFEIKVADYNAAKKSEYQNTGDNTYYSVFTSQVENALPYKLKEGDFVIVYVKNTNTTISQMIKAVIYGITGNSADNIYTQASGTVFATGTGY